MISHSTIALIGAGMTGLLAADTLLRHGIQCCIIDKGILPGGRMASRTLSPIGHGDHDIHAPLTVNHGVPLIQCTTPAFAEWLSTMQCRPTPLGWYSPNGFKSMMIRYAESLQTLSPALCTLHQKAQITSAQYNVHTMQWELSTGDGLLCTADYLVCTTPLPQALPLLLPMSSPLVSEHPSAYSRLLSEEDATLLSTAIQYHSCFAVMIAHPMLDAKASCSSAIIDRSAPFAHDDAPSSALIIYTTHTYTQEHWDSPHEHILADIRKECVACGALPLSAEIRIYSVHRWKFSQAVTTYPDSFFVHDRLYLAGDGFGTMALYGVERAYHSGLSCANDIMRRILR